jgi:hypothetical protein
MSAKQPRAGAHRQPADSARAPQEKAAVRRWLHGQAAAAARSREAAARAGPDPRQAVAEALSAVRALGAMGVWPGPRDPASEAAVNEVRRRWAGIQKRAIRDREG